MTLMFSSLGFASKLGREGVDEAVQFKRQLRSQLPFPDGVSPMIVPHKETHQCEVRVAYDRSFPRAESWRDRAAELAPSIWEKVQRQSRERVPG